MADRAPLDYPVFQAFDANGDPLANGKVEFFDAGTTNQRDTYSDPGLTTANPNPVTLNSRGEPESGGGTPVNIYLDASPYKIVLKDSDDVTVRTIDDYLRPDVGESISAPKDPINATDVGTDIFEAVFTDPKSGEVFTIDFQSSNTTTTPTLENTGGSLAALTMKTRDGGELWAGSLFSAHKLYYDGTDLLVLDPDYERGSSPEHATDSGTDAFVSATNTNTPGGGNTVVRDFQSPNTTTTPTLDSLTITARDGSPLWAGALSGVHELQLNAGGTAWLCLDPNPIDEDDMASDSDAAVPTQQSVAAFVGVQKIEEGSISAASSLDITGLSSSYQYYLIVLSKIVPDTDNVGLSFKVSGDGGSNFDGGSGYRWVTNNNNGGQSTSTGDSEIHLTRDNFGTGAEENGFSGHILLFDPADAAKETSLTAAFSPHQRSLDTNYVAATSFGVRKAEKVIDAIRIFASAGNISFDYAVYGGR